MVAPANLLTRLGLVAAISLGYLSGSCHASLTSLDVSFKDADKLGAASSGPLDEGSEQPLVEEPAQIDINMTGDATNSIQSNFLLTRNLSGSACFVLKPTARDKVYLFSWMWMPKPPAGALLKVPIFDQANRCLI